MEFFSKNPGLSAFVEGASAFAQGVGETRRRGKPQCPNALRGELLLRKKLRGMSRIASGMPRNSNTDAVMGQKTMEQAKHRRGLNVPRPFGKPCAAALDGIVPQPPQPQGSREVEARFATAARVLQTVPCSYPAPAGGQKEYGLTNFGGRRAGRQMTVL